MKNRGKRCSSVGLVLGLLALGIITGVLFKFPQPGVADQGDFTRVMLASGLELKAENANDPHFVRFLDYIVTDYQITDTALGQLLCRIGATSIAYLITLISLICQAFGQDIFKTGYLAAAYVMMYVLALYIIFKYMKLSNNLKLFLFAITSFFVLLDGNYLVWFNSLYGEPMMITTLMLYIAAWIYYIYHRYSLKSEEKIFSKLLFIFFSAFLFLGSKIQVAYVLPVILLMLTRLIIENKHLVKPYQMWLLCVFYVITMVYPVGLVAMDKSVSRDRQYNSVFYGVLKDSENPGQDLEKMGLNPDMAVEAGKHSYLPVAEYVRYAPHSQITRDQFYDKISNAKLVKFYLTHPARFLQGMEYTASQAFFTSTFLGKYESNYSEEPIREFNRFTLWSSFREHHLPKRLWFLAVVYSTLAVVSLMLYFKYRGFDDIKARLQLLWGVMIIGFIQFPMPFVGNGQADTAKQLYLFNFVFDLMLIVSACWFLNKFVDFCISKKSFLINKNPFMESQ